MDTLLFCYANNRDQPLHSLGEEDTRIDQLLDLRSSQNQFQKVRESFATTDSIAAKILSYKDSLCLFHYSGHAGSDVLILEDSPARGAGMAQLLAQCPNLKLIFLNGCSTLNHIKLLADQQVNAAVIATATPVEDTTATQFAIDFYQALVNQYSLTEALTDAQQRLQLKVATAIQPITRSMFATAGAVSVNQWYFYYPNDETAKWELPTGVATEATAYIPNDTIRRTLFVTFCKYDPTLNQLYKTKQSLADDALRDWVHEEELRRLPYLIADPLRKLLCRQLLANNTLVAPTATLDRLTNYVNLFDSSIDLLMSILLAQIRNWLQANEQQQAPSLIDPATKTLLQDIVTNGWSSWKPNDNDAKANLVTTIQTLHTFINQQQIPYFIPELSDWVNQFSTDTSLLDALQFVDSLKKRLAEPNRIGNIPSLCKRGEDHLSNWLKNAGFWASYRLESFKNIRAVRFYQQPPAYRHQMVVLRSQVFLDGSNSFQEIQLTDLWDCQSVLLVKIQRRLTTDLITVEDLVPGGFLNLAPFIIDKNVFLKSDNTVFDLYSFHASESGLLRYKHISAPGDSLLTIGPDDDFSSGRRDFDFSVLREQIESLHSLLEIHDNPSSPITAPTSNDDIDLSRI